MDQKKKPTIESRRIQLHNKLVELLGSNNVYFDPPETIKMKYPCIVYDRSDDQSIFADDKRYNLKIRYQITVISKNPDIPILNDLFDMMYCYYDRHFTSNNLHHDVFNIYY